MESPDRREQLARIARAATGDVVTVRAAADALGSTSTEASRTLSALVRAGWTRRLRRGLYQLLPVESTRDAPSVPGDPWLVASEAFEPCYIGGWSAAEHWGLTEQLFRTTVVITAANIRTRTPELGGHSFRLVKVSPRRLEDGVVSVWRDQEQVRVSGRERTLVDGLRDPSLCGGIRHLADMLVAYSHADEADVGKLVRIASRTGNGAAWKRLGYLSETLWPNAGQISREAEKHLTAGNARLDPAVARWGRLATRWRLWVNVPIRSESANGA